MVNTAGKYHERPFTVRAMQYLGTTESERDIEAWCGQVLGWHGDALLLQSPLGIQRVEPNDWVVQDAHGLTVLRDWQFDMTYEAVDG